MICPKCGHEQPEGRPDCGKCGIVFAKWTDRTLRESHPASPPPSPPEGVTTVATAPPTEGRFPLLPLVAFLAFLILGAALRPVFFPRGLPMPEHPYRNEAHGFALSVPPEWIMLTPENYSALSATYGDGFPSTLRENLGKGGIAVGFFKVEEGQQLAPSINIVPVKGQMPPLSEKDLPAVTDPLVQQFKTLFDDYQLASAELVSVDKLTSLRLVGTATLKIRTQASAPAPVPLPDPALEKWWRKPQTAQPVWSTISMTALQVLVPGAKESYVITCTSKTEDAVANRQVFDPIVDSFRVLQRPDPYGPFLTGALKTSLLSALAYLAIYLIYSVVRRLSRP